MSDVKYFNFPVQLLAGFLKDKSKVLDNIFDYAISAKVLTLEGTEEKRTNDSLKYFGVTHGDSKACLKNGLKWYNSLPTFSPMVGINKSVYFDYYKNHKDEFEIVCLLAFLAIKSIVQNKPYCKIDNNFLLSRMDGNAKTVSDYTELSPEVARYANEYQTKKIKTELSNGWGLVTYSRYTRGFYVSFTLSIEDLVFEAEKRRKSTKEKQSKEREKEAVKMALIKLNTKTI